MANHKNTYPKLPPLGKPLPGLIQEQLETAKRNWNNVYGSVAQLKEFVPLGQVSSDANRVDVIQWICAHSRLLTGDLLASETLRTIAPNQIKAPAEERATFETSVADRTALTDVVIETRWTDAGHADFSTLTIAGSSCCQGIKYDSMLSNAALFKQVFIPPSEAETDTFHLDFGWIWALITGSYTRGHVDFKLSCIPGPPGCKWSFDCSMNIGSCSVAILPSPPVKIGGCCTTSYAWAVATGTVNVTVTPATLAVTISGSFGSVATGAGSLTDCCPPLAGGGQLAPGGGSTVGTTPGGTTVVTTPGGTTIVTTPGGTTIVTTPGGTTVVTTPGGTPSSGGEGQPGGQAPQPPDNGSECGDQFTIEAEGVGIDLVTATDDGRNKATFRAAAQCTRPGCETAQLIRDNHVVRLSDVHGVVTVQYSGTFKCV